MHQALLIDEIVRNIFHYIHASGGKALPDVARCCKAWKDPALDQLWTHLTSITPLFRLVSGMKQINDMFVISDTVSPTELTTFMEYARRIKHITHQRGFRIHPELFSLLTSNTPSCDAGALLPSLQVVRLSSSSCQSLQPSLCISRCVRKLDIDLGFKRSLPHMTEIHQQLDQIMRTTPVLWELHLRGSASKEINDIISARCRNLRVLSLRLGATLTTDALQAIMAFPDLLELSIHAGHVDIEEIQKFHLGGQDIHIFPVLRKLDIRARLPLLEFLFQHIPKDTLHVLRIGIDHTSVPGPSWINTFSLLSNQASNTLQEFSLEHHIEVDEWEPNPESSTEDRAQLTNPLSWEVLKPLRALRHLNRLVFDTTIPPDIGDANIPALVTWWPALQHLDLGSIPSPKICYNSKLTLACLPHIAHKLPQLHSLILPVDTYLVPPLIRSPGDPGPHTLKRLTVTHPHNPDPSSVAQYIHRLFPYLLQLDGPIEQAEQWNLTQAHMRMLRTFGTRRRSSSVMKTFHHH